MMNYREIDGIKNTKIDFTYFKIYIILFPMGLLFY